MKHNYFQRIVCESLQIQLKHVNKCGLSFGKLFYVKWAKIFKSLFKFGGYIIFLCGDSFKLNQTLF
jgi:hypothetical protein